MLVYKSGRLNREVIPISKNDYILRLSHPTSGMVIETKFVSGSNSDSQRKESLFKVYKEVDGKWLVYRNGDNKVLKSINYSPANLSDIINV